MADLNKLAGDWQVWKVGTKNYVVQMVGLVEPPVPIVWEVQTQKQLQNYFGTRPIHIDKTYSTEQFRKSGALVMGVSSELNKFSEDPMDDFARSWNQEKQIRPWLSDPEILGLSIAAYLEGRAELSPTEIQGTEWWRTHNSAERQWIQLWHADPSTARQQLQDNQIMVTDLLQQAGVKNAPRGVTRYIAGQWSMGMWSDEYAKRQIRGLSDPYAGIRMDQGLADTIQGTHLDSTRQQEDTVRDTLQQWLGPKFGDWDQTRIERKAGQLRNNPDGLIEFEEQLRRQRASLFPEYDENLTYEDIASPWRGVWQSSWGETADEKDPLFLKILRENDVHEAETMLRREGLNRGNKTVRSNLVNSLGEAYGTGVMRSF